MSSTSTPGDTAPGLPSAACLFLVWAFLLYLARIWSKIGKNDPWGSDGTAISLAMVASIAHVACIYNAWHHGYGRESDSGRSEDQSAVVRKSLYAAEIFYITSISLTRTSTALFTARILNLGQGYRRLVQATIAICALSIPAFILAIALRNPIAAPWDALNRSEELYTRWVAVETIGLIIDVGTLAFSIWVIWRLQMSVGKRVTVCMLFAVRLLIIPVVACRLAKLEPLHDGEQPPFSIIESILTEAEVQLYLVLASATCLKPLFQPFHPGFFAAENGTLAVTGYTNRPGATGNGSRDAYYELSGQGASRNRDRKQPVFSVSARDDAMSDEVDLVQSHRHGPVTAMRPDEGETWSEAIAASNPGPRPLGDGRRIAATTTWTVRYEERES